MAPVIGDEEGSDKAKRFGVLSPASKGFLNSSAIKNIVIVSYLKRYLTSFEEE